ncbi:MAG: ABC transporter ATP-binding protein [Myxococcaceae bacterium]|nr:ABC transporter ATP-binding protein [Myxococcaceae bacterium]
MHDVSFTVAPGQLWALLGPNGAGKSTLLKVGLGVLPCSSGRVLLGDVDTKTLSRRELARHLAWVPQSPAEDTGFTALELVLMGRAPHLGTLGLPSKGDADHALKLLAEVGLEALASRRLDEMSGGERRLCYLARAKLQGARLLLFDEPTAFLDVKNQVECLKSLQVMTQAGVGALVVLHDVNLAVQWATHAALLKQGRLLAAGPVGEVLKAEALSTLYGVNVVDAGAGLFTARSAT